MPPLPGAPDIPGLEISGEVVALGRGRQPLGARRQGVRAGRRRRLCGILPRRGGLDASRAGGPYDARGGGAAGDLLHRVDQCVRSRRAEGGRDLPGPWRHAPASAPPRSSSPRRYGATVFATRRQRREMRGLPHPRRRSRHRLQDPGLRRRGEDRDRRQGRQCHPRHGRRLLYRPQLRGRGAAGPHRADRLHGRLQGADRLSCG